MKPNNLFFTACLLFSSLFVSKAAPVKVILELQDGSQVPVEISENMKISVTPDLFSVFSSSDNYIFEIDEVRKFYYADQANISLPTKNTLSYKFDGRLLIIDNIGELAGSDCRIYSGEGALVASNVVVNDRIEIDFSDYTAGVYVVMFDRSKSIKVLVK